ncbi:MAG TPA: YggS family pyridoxal phosphate enzyme [Solirubrobacteraceae bacterium]|nr:YggS family pyridoxal phosphate enzyme [Solirubrobacteraceae bacterium]
MALTAERVRANLAEVRDEIAAAARRAGRDPAGVEIVAAVKYVALEDLGALAEAGVATVAENRAQELERKSAAHSDAFTWDFIGQLQSRKVRTIAPLARRIHSVASDSALKELRKHARPGLEFLVEVNIAGEEGKAGIAPDELGAFIDRAPFPPVGLMTMPPLAERPEDSRRWFAALRELAERHGLAHLSMGTTQDFAVAVEEGATMVRIGSRLYG